MANESSRRVARNRQLAKQLVKNYVAWRNQDGSQRAECDREDYLASDCCPFHRRLDDRLGVLEHRAERLEFEMIFQGNSSRGVLFSASWWRAFQKTFAVEVPNELTQYMES